VSGLAFDRFYQVWLENIVCGAPHVLLYLSYVLTHITGLRGRRGG
jgi:hypothetical protein